MRARQYASGMKIEDAIKIAMARMIERREGHKVEVSGWEEEYDVYMYNSGCSCADYDKDFSVTIRYFSKDGRGSFSYPGTFAELIKELDVE